MTVTEDATKLSDLGYKAGTSTDKSKMNANGSFSLNSQTNVYYAEFCMFEETNFGIVNTKSGIIPTGIIITVAPYATVALAGFLGIIVFAKHKKTKEEEDE